MWKQTLLLLAFLALPAPAQVGGFGGLVGPGAIVQRVFNQITTAQVSGAISNVGQSQHIIVILFPAEVADVSPIQVRLEGSFDGVTWFPINRDATIARALAGSGSTIVYDIETAYGPLPLVRVNSVVNTPGAELMDVFYVGNIIPIIPAVILTPDRIIL